MYVEHESNGVCEVTLACDKCGCSITVVEEDHKSAQHRLFMDGWLCPKHVEQVARRLNRAAQRAWSV